VKLIPPKYSDKVYHREGFHSEVDFESVDYNLYPKLAGVRIIEAEIRPGELLFIPVAWWHHVKALDISITVTGSGFAFPNRFESLSKYYE
jgi:ribosomal protein L16 Arg81 hydroxylase